MDDGVLEQFLNILKEEELVSIMLKLFNILKECKLE
jgi:hypothetical protein